MKFLNNIVEQAHRRIERLVRPGLGFKSFTPAPQTLPGYEAMAMIGRGRLSVYQRMTWALSATSLLPCSA
nr:transposase [Microvirga ossetica]